MEDEPFRLCREDVRNGGENFSVRAQDRCDATDAVRSQPFERVRKGLEELVTDDELGSDGRPDGVEVRCTEPLKACVVVERRNLGAHGGLARRQLVAHGRRRTLNQRAHLRARRRGSRQWSEQVVVIGMGA